MKIQNNLKILKRRKTIFIVIMLLLPLAQFAILTMYPTVKTILMAFESPTRSGEFGLFENLETFKIEWESGTMWQNAVANSLGYFPASVLIMLPLSIITAYILYKKLPGASFYKIVFFIPNIISITVMGLAFRNMFSLNGPVNALLKAVGVAAEDIPVWFNDEAVTMKLLYFYSIWAGIGYNCVLLFGALSRIPTEIMESAELDGCKTFRMLFSVCIPIMWPTISSMIIFGTTTVFAMFIHSEVLTDGTGNTETVALIIMRRIRNGKNPNYAAALSLMLTLIAVPIVQGVKKLLDKIYDTVEV